jgi:aspartate carbamoyltransferase catalytic subunit
MSVPTNCVLCGRELFTNPPIKEIKCEQCEEIERLEKYIETLNVVHFTEIQREKATVERYEKALKSIYEIIGYEDDEKMVDVLIETVEKALKG